MGVNKGLGKGLSALFHDTVEDYNKTADVMPTAEELKNGVVELNLTDIYANPNQPRKIFDEAALTELASSIEAHGVITPIVVNKDADGKYMIIAGERRFRASKLVKKTTIPAVIREYTEREIKEISLIENLQREDLNPIEAATAMQQLMDEYSLTQEDLADRLGKSRSAVANTIRLLSLVPEVVKLVTNNKLSAGHARALVTLPAEAQLKIALKAVESGMSVREVELEVKEYFNPTSERKKVNKIKNENKLSAELKDLIERMQRSLGTKVSAIGNDRKGRIYIDYYTTDDLDRLSEVISHYENLKR